MLFIIRDTITGVNSNRRSHLLSSFSNNSPLASFPVTPLSLSLLPPPLAPSLSLPPVALSLTAFLPILPRSRYDFSISALYRGMQCSTCGVRFDDDRASAYSAHLDWHFRHNRRDQESYRKASSRKWYYPLEEWVQFEEISELDEAGGSFRMLLVVKIVRIYGGAGRFVVREN